jgi:hypothetical protein
MEVKPEISKKNVAFWGQLFAAVWIGAWTAYKFISAPANITMDDIIYSGIGIMGIFSPVIISVWLEKIKDIRFGKPIQ